MTADSGRAGVHTSPATARWLPAAGGRLLAAATDTDGQFSVIDSVVPPHDSTPLHRHDAMDESLVILEGSVTATCGDRDISAAAGDFVHLPRGVAHRYVAGPAGARMLIISTPGGLERFFDDWQSGMGLDRAAKANGIVFLD